MVVATDTLAGDSLICLRFPMLCSCVLWRRLKLFQVLLLSLPGFVQALFGTLPFRLLAASSRFLLSRFFLLQELLLLLDQRHRIDHVGKIGSGRKLSRQWSLLTLPSLPCRTLQQLVILCLLGRETDVVGRAWQLMRSVFLRSSSARSTQRVDRRGGCRVHCVVNYLPSRPFSQLHLFGRWLLWICCFIWWLDSFHRRDSTFSAFTNFCRCEVVLRWLFGLWNKRLGHFLGLVLA